MSPAFHKARHLARLVKDVHSAWASWAHDSINFNPVWLSIMKPLQPHFTNMQGEKNRSKHHQTESRDHMGYSICVQNVQLEVGREHYDAVHTVACTVSFTGDQSFKPSLSIHLEIFHSEPTMQAHDILYMWPGLVQRDQRTRHQKFWPRPWRSKWHHSGGPFQPHSLHAICIVSFTVYIYWPSVNIIE